jgi:hypothetical protein
MGLAVSFLQGSKEEWSLVRRHPSERIFGVQIAGNTPASLASTAEAIGRQCDGNIDFVDLNCGCPIDLVYQQGAGSARKSMKAPTARILLISNYSAKHGHKTGEDGQWYGICSGRHPGDCQDANRSEGQPTDSAQALPKGSRLGCRRGCRKQ